MESMTAFQLEIQLFPHPGIKRAGGRLGLQGGARFAFKLLKKCEDSVSISQGAQTRGNGFISSGERVQEAQEQTS